MATKGAKHGGMLFRVLCCVALVCKGVPVNAAPGGDAGSAVKVSFSALNLSNDGRVLFRADAAVGGNRTQSAVLVSRLTDLSLTQLTAFPETIESLDNGRTLQIRNMFGCMRVTVAGGLPAVVAAFPSFTSGALASKGRLESVAVSENGAWIVFIRPVSPAYGDLVLVNALSGEETLVATQVELPDCSIPVRWNTDSQVFIYERGGNIYYYPVELAIPPDERYRLIGEGSLASAAWGSTGDFFYLRGSTVYRVRGSEVFFRSLYRDFLEIGTAVAVLPVPFDPRFDAFYLAPDSRSLLLSTGRSLERSLFFYPLDAGVETALPYLRLQDSRFSILWAADRLTVIVSVREKGKTGTLAYRLNTTNGRAFVPVAVPECSGVALSPNGARALFWGDAGVTLFDYTRWRMIAQVSGTKAYSCLWLGDSDFVVGDAARIERVHIEGTELSRRLICLSAADSVAFEERENRILAQSGDVWFVTDGKSPWAEIKAPAASAVSLVSGRYRVYLEKQYAGPYENLPMIRSITSVGTTPLLPVPVQVTSTTSSLPEAALCFDLYDDDTGLDRVLDALDRFGLKATFFLNGEFIRRHPHAVKAIADAGHEAASLFFAPLDLTSSRYRIDRDFIERGLARNEDEFFAVTGQELELLWHPPFYATSPAIRAAAESAGYQSVHTTFDPQGNEFAAYPAASLVDALMERKQPLSIIPIRLGLVEGQGDYLFNRINIILDSFISAGYALVPVSTLMERAK
jgi:peptidoglycan/xylan/chitin deacetylase (PgdA/CDA1 family)